MGDVSYISNTDFYLEVVKGNVPGHSLLNKFGRNPDVPNGTFEFINTLGFTQWQLSAPTAVRIKAGGNAADTAAGAGAREITVIGLDGTTLEEVSETIATTGAAASAPTTRSFWRVHRAYVSQCGTYGGNNVGNIVVENSGGGTDLIQILADDGQTQFGAYSVPAGKTAHFLSLTANVEGGKPADIAFYIRGNLDDTTAPVQAKRIQLWWDGVDGLLNYNPRSPGPIIPEKTDAWAEAKGSGVNTQVSLVFSLMLVDNDIS